MSLGCARCGDCCDPVTIPKDIVDDVLTPWHDYWAAGGTDPLPEGADPTIRFVYDHMVRVDRADGPDQVAYECDQFDTTSRLCQAHDDAPPMCKSFPWYQDGEADGYRVSKLPPRCSYALDAPPGIRRPDARPLIPLTVR